MNNRIPSPKKSEAIRLKISAVAVVILLSLLIVGSGSAQRGNVQSTFFGSLSFLAQATPTPGSNDGTGPALPPQKIKKSKKNDSGSRGCIECDPGGGGGGNNVPPVSYTGGPYYSEAGQTIQTYGGNSYDPDGTISSYQWNFGDGTIGTGVSPTHTYAVDGTYTVSLTVTDNNGAITNSSSTVTVNANPEPVTISFNNLPVGTVVSNQYSQVAFSSSNNFYYPTTVYSQVNCYCATSSPSNYLISYPANAFQEIYLDFTKPVNNFSFYVIASDSLGIIGYIDVYRNGSLSGTYYIPGNGNPYVPIYIDGLRSLTNITRIRIHAITDAAGLGFDDFTFTPVGKVESLSLEQIDSPLDTNPGASGGLSVNDNRRIFPDKQSATDTVNRRRVRVRANTSLGANKTVYFRAFDVDDPSTDASPVDTNGNAGGDNKGVPATSLGGLSALSAQTDSNGVATVEFMTTMQPGDNFRIAASADQAYINGLFASGVNINDSAGNSLPTEKAKASPMLTVWRNLHMEVDSMGPVTGNRITGTITGGIGCRTIPGSSTPCEEPIYFLDRPDIGTGYGDSYNGANRFNQGRLIVNGVWYEVLGIGCCGSECISCPPRTMITIRTPGGSGPPIGAAYALVDDDDFNSDDGWNYDGDEGENIPRPDTNRLQFSDDPNLNVFAPAYVRPKYDIGDNNDFAPFVLNSPSQSTSGLIATYDFDAAGTEADNNFWTAYLLGGYQCEAEGDMDPLSEQDREPSKTSVGVTDGSNMGSTIFFEMFAEYRSILSETFNPASTAAHEIGHLFNTDHPDGGLMAPSGTPGRTNAFTLISLNKIRSSAHP